MCQSNSLQVRPTAAAFRLCSRELTGSGLNIFCACCCTLLSLYKFVSAALQYTKFPYSRFGQTNALYAVQVPLSSRYCRRRRMDPSLCFASVAILLTWGDQVALQSKVKPSTSSVSFSVISTPFHSKTRVPIVYPSSYLWQLP